MIDDFEFVVAVAIQRSEFATPSASFEILFSSYDVDSCSRCFWYDLKSVVFEVLFLSRDVLFCSRCLSYEDWDERSDAVKMFVMEEFVGVRRIEEAARNGEGVEERMGGSKRVEVFDFEIS